MLIVLALQIALDTPYSAAGDEFVASRPVAATAPEFGIILARFAAMPGLSAEFREEKRLALLMDPLISEGAIYFTPPDRLARHVRSPIPSVVLLLGDRVSYDFKGDRGDLDIDSHPMIRGMSGIFRLLLTGDAEGLERLFDIKAEIAGSGAWEIVLHPRDQPLRDSIDSMRIRGKGAQLTELYIAERNGDETTTSFSDVDSARQFSAGEAEQFFRLPQS